MSWPGSNGRRKIREENRERLNGLRMIRRFRAEDLLPVMEIWLTANKKAHSFVPEQYWMDHLEEVENMMPQAELYVYEEENTHQISGFIGLMDDYIAGIFVKDGEQSKGIGKQLLDYVKERKSTLTLSVYQKNIRAVSFYQREQFSVQSEGIDADTNEKEFTMVWR